MPSFNLKVVLELLARDIAFVQEIINPESEVIDLVTTPDTPILDYMFRRAFVQLVMDIV